MMNTLPTTGEQTQEISRDLPRIALHLLTGDLAITVKWY